MEGSKREVRRWEDLNKDILVRIFQTFDITELTPDIGHICSNWRLAAFDPLLWKTLDLTALRSNFIYTRVEPYVYVDSRSDRSVTRALRIALNLSHGHILTLIFHYNLYVSEDQFSYTYERCPNLRRLVMPSMNRIKKSGFLKAVHVWHDLESLTVPSIPDLQYVMKEISENCKKFSELKIMGPCGVEFATALVTCIPNLKVLSLRCNAIAKDALIILLDGLQQLERLNISHCLLVDGSDDPEEPGKLLNCLDDSILQKGSRLRQFATCMSDSCIMCQRTRCDEGRVRWYKYEEHLWKVDEVESLAL